VLVVHAHPVASSFGAGLRDRAVAALVRGGHQVDLLDLYADGFDPVLSEAEHAVHGQDPSPRPELLDHARRLRSAEALVLVHPTWWGGQPAILKGWFDRVWAAGVAFTLVPGSTRPRAGLRNLRRLVVVTTHGSSKWTNALQGEPGKHLVGRGLRPLCHPLARTRWIALYGLDRVEASERERFLRRVDDRLSRPRL